MSSLQQRFWSKVWIDPDSDCWIWEAAKTAGGYGQIAVNGKPAYANRVSYERDIGPLLPGQILMHLCGEPSCVNPNHMFAGTPAEVAAKRKELNMPKKEPNVELSVSTREKIRRRYEAGQTQVSLAREYGITQARVAYICQRFEYDSYVGH